MSNNSNCRNKSEYSNNNYYIINIDIFTLFIISVLALGHYLCEKYYMNMVSATSGRLML